MARIDPLAVFVFVWLLAGAPASAQDVGLAQQFSRGLFTPGTSAKLALGLLYDQTAVAVPEWGSGRSGLGRRAEWLAAGHVARYTAEFATAKLLGDDTSYQRCLCKGFPRRAAHALHAEFVERKRDGSAGFAVARLTGVYVSAVATAPMLPARYGVADFNNRAVSALAIDEGFNILQEFWPEIKRTLLFRKNSK